MKVLYIYNPGPVVGLMQILDILMRDDEKKIPMLEIMRWMRQYRKRTTHSEFQQLLIRE